MAARNVEINVGNGPTTQAGIWGTVIGGLTTLGTLITVLAGGLPAGVDPNVGLGLTAAAGFVTVLIHLATGLSRSKFAQAKADVMAGKGDAAYQDIFGSLVDPDDDEVVPEDPEAPVVTPPVDIPPVDPDPEEPTDTNVTPPVEP